MILLFIVLEKEILRYATLYKLIMVNNIKIYMNYLYVMTKNFRI